MMSDNSAKRERYGLCTAVVIQKYSLETGRGWKVLVYLKNYRGPGKFRSMQNEAVLPL